MIIVKIWGGLGNQMFQYAFGYMLSKKYNKRLYLDIDFYKNQPSYVGQRNYMLDKLSIPEVAYVRRRGIISFLENWFINRIIQRVPRVSLEFPHGLYFYKERRKKFDEKVSVRENKINYFDGYWQSPKYFSEYKEELKRMFRYRNIFPCNVDVLLNQMQKCESVSVHIRKGDFRKKKKIGINIGKEMPLSYYEKAIQYIRQNVRNPVFYIFSDDFQWVSENLGNSQEFQYMNMESEDGEVLDLLCMTYCRHGILSASTFSWWGNWLKDESKDSIIIAPKGEYFNNRFLEERWIKM
ncbi:MAG: alpha-1,2-fucosyltransferase [Roseburia sp.]|nr:alpha-1,2-fucosyltransferase [Roseburia sp.]MCM1277886.1 alpha-1,2-fucosyltransferase [Robinsoniella sp.]